MRKGVLGAIVVAVWLLPAGGSAQVVHGVGRFPPAVVTPAPQRPVDSRRLEQPAPAADEWQRGHDARRFDPSVGHSPGMLTPGAGRDLFRVGPHFYARRFDRRPRFFRHRYPFVSGYGYLTDAYFPSFPSSMYQGFEYPDERRAPTESNGYLRLQVQPEAAQVYVDGYFAGTVAEFGVGRSLAAGAHSVEIRVPGFKTVSFAVRIVPNETVTYRADLERIEPTPQPRIPVTAAASPKTLYVIPRCYAGDTPPRAEQLPAGCDASDVRAVRR